MQIFPLILTGKTIILGVEAHYSIAFIKDIIFDEHYRIPPNQQRLFVFGIEIEDGLTRWDYGIQNWADRVSIETLFDTDPFKALYLPMP